MLAGMPYKRIPKHFKRELVLTCITMLNVVPRDASVSNTLSPMELLSGRSLDFKNIVFCHPVLTVLFTRKESPETQ